MKHPRDDHDHPTHEPNDATSAMTTPAIDDAAAPEKKRRKLRKGKKKFKAERLAQRSAPVPDASDNALASLRAFLARPDTATSNAWDVAQDMALRIGSDDAKVEVIRAVLMQHGYAKAAAHYAKRMALSRDALLTMLQALMIHAPSEKHGDDGQRHHQHRNDDDEPAAVAVTTDETTLGKKTKKSAPRAMLMAKFLVELPRALLSPAVVTTTLVLPWLRSDDKNDTNAARLVLQHAEDALELQRQLVTAVFDDDALAHEGHAYASSLAPVLQQRVATIRSSSTSITGLAVTNLSDDELERERQRRQAVAQRLARLVRQLWADARVVPFGSSATRLLTSAQDDIDLCVLLPSEARFQKDTADVVQDMKDHLSLYLEPATTTTATGQDTGATDDAHPWIFAVLDARIPIVRVVDPVTRLQCDLCVNNVAALWNTELIQFWLQSPVHGHTGVVQQMSRWLKQWRRARMALFGTSLSSYGLQLLLIYFLQQRHDLPVVDCSSVFHEDAEALATLDTDAIRGFVHEHSLTPTTNDPASAQPWSVAALLVQFFMFYACEFDFTTHVVSLRYRHPIEKAAKEWTRKAWSSSLAIEDPIEVERDLGKLFTRKSLGRLRAEFTQTMAVTDGAPEAAHEAATQRKNARANDQVVKLQHFLVMKAFNLRRARQTLTQQFQFLKQTDPVTGKECLSVNALCEYLQVPPFRRLILQQVFSLTSTDKYVDFNLFLHFLQTAAVQAGQEEKQLRRNDPPLPPPPPRFAADNQSDGDQQIVCFQPSLLSSQARFAHPPPAPGLWKKREVTIQERITEYTKIDENGRPQHLVEKEKHQTEVIHMESLNGEFAHREVTHFEQLEQLNDEIVHHDQGREEFLHLKSQHDEISRFESTIPANSGQRYEECEQPPPSPTIKRDPSTMVAASFDGDNEGVSDPAMYQPNAASETYDQFTTPPYEAKSDLQQDGAQMDAPEYDPRDDIIA
ncbi:TPA: hypothetical protein N0F65_010828 [Lagenidium giganteum]|uniref:PAP-associated domain-containing protein n=1 Tax=Lagenidium giganteum TaxID=4803 RepID=A0AAV2Z4C2_9STRA|nr:TPA: hypothetical protein N0F65_010828 [Lagenidium giganteum]